MEREGLKPYPFWTTRAEYDALMATKSSNDVVLIIEDVEFEFVDHAEKPFVFLEMIEIWSTKGLLNILILIKST